MVPDTHSGGQLFGIVPERGITLLFREGLALKLGAERMLHWIFGRVLRLQMWTALLLPLNDC